jgi:signal transduction histidine kinase
VHDLLPERFRAAHVDHIRIFGSTGVTTRSMGALRPLAARRKDGTEFPIEAAISQVDVSGQKIFTVILRDISERKTAEAERERLLEAERSAREAAEMANQAKADFLAMMSHELRTPLNAIAGYVQLLDMEIHGALNPSQHEALQRVQRSQRRLLRLINDVLNFARLESTHLEYTLSVFPVVELLASLEPVIQPLIEQKSLTYEQHVDLPGQSFIHADLDRVQQILLNVIANAVKFTPEGGKISLRVDTRPDHVELHVADSGRGIAPENQTKIFEPFVQLDRQLAPDEGVGLGLAISRDLAKAMGGNLTVESTVGAGSVFTLTLPTPR